MFYSLSRLKPENEREFSNQRKVILIRLEKSGNFTQNTGKIRNLINNLRQLRIFMSYLSTNIFCLATLCTYIFINIALSDTAIQNRLPPVVSLKKKQRVVQANTCVDATFTEKKRLGPGILLKKVLENEKKILEKPGKFDSPKKWKPCLLMTRL